MKSNPNLLLDILFLFLLLQKRIENKRMAMNDSLFKTIVVDPLKKKNYAELAKISEIAEKELNLIN